MKVIFTSILLACCSILFSQAPDTWVAKANYPGAATSFITGFSIGSVGYFGPGGASVHTNQLWEYNPGTNVWTQKANVPGPGRRAATSLSINGKGYIGG